MIPPTICQYDPFTICEHDPFTICENQSTPPLFQSRRTTPFQLWPSQAGRRILMSPLSITSTCSEAAMPGDATRGRCTGWTFLPSRQPDKEGVQELLPSLQPCVSPLVIHPRRARRVLHRRTLQPHLVLLVLASGHTAISSEFIGASK